MTPDRRLELTMAAAGLLLLSLLALAVWAGYAWRSVEAEADLAECQRTYAEAFAIRA